MTWGSRTLRLLVRACARSTREQRGFALVEVMVAAGLLAIVAVGVFAGIDGPAATSAGNRAKSVAASLAEQDQERMRAMKFTDLDGLSGLTDMARQHIVGPHFVTKTAVFGSGFQHRGERTNDA